jgi:hypothetical protein
MRLCRYTSSRQTPFSFDDVMQVLHATLGIHFTTNLNSMRDVQERLSSSSTSSGSDHEATRRHRSSQSGRGPQRGGAGRESALKADICPVFVDPKMDFSTVAGLDG